MTRRQHRREKNGEQGFAMLIVFLLAAAIALMLYQQMPRVAFESEREKEALLQGRGKQYVRAIQLYYVAFKKYPTKIEDLENTNNKRFLRRRYIDPMTGKDEWRLIHANGAGQLIDSLVQKPPAPPSSNGASGTTNNGSNPNNPQSGNNPFGTAFGTAPAPGATGSTGSTGADAPPEVNSTVLRRPSDRSTVPLPGSTPPADVDPNDPRYWPPITTLTPQQIAQQSGQTGTQQTNNGQPQYPGQQQGFPGQQFPGQQFPGQQFPGQQQVPGQQTYLSPSSTTPQYPGQGSGLLPGGYQPGLPGQVPQNNQQLLGQIPGLPNADGTIPGAANPNGNPLAPTGNPINPNFTGAANPVQSGTGPMGMGGPLAGINASLRTQTNPTTAGGPLGPGGLVGVASTFKGASIKVYKDRQKYEEWEFLFDMSSLTQPGQMPGLGQGTPQAGQPGQPGQPANGTSGTANGSSLFPGMFPPTTPTTPATPTTVH